jgi:nicotinate-nucleotide pyrophosphorylase (carboxylating)
LAAAEAFRLRDKRCRVSLRVKEGTPLRKGQVLLTVTGPLASLLSAERTALNAVTHMSGIATLTHEFVRRCRPSPRGGRLPIVLDTRKTLPGLRDMQKWAVRCGGGTNHRRDLASAVLIKENHLSLVRDEAGLKRLFQRIRSLQGRGLIVEMECQNRKHILWGLFSRADILLLDNFPVNILPRVVRWIAKVCSDQKLKRPLLEVSGGVSLETIGAIARSGVDRISVGRLTHSAPILDMSLDVRPL